MAEDSKIEWTDHTFNPWVGCQKVSPACDHCYAEGWAKRSGLVEWGPHAERSRTSVANWRKPVTWNLRAGLAGVRERVFCASLADVFDNAVPAKWRADLWTLIAQTPHLDWLLLTKRPGNIAGMLPPSWGAGWHNAWLGCTVVNQDEADRDVPKLLSVPAKVRFLSMEPLLGPVRLDQVAAPHGMAEGQPWLNALSGFAWDNDGDTCPTGDRLDWIIVGGESGPGARPMHPSWARSLRDQCQAAGVAFHFKQWGEWAPICSMSEDEVDALYVPAPESDPDASRRCRSDSLVLDADGTSCPIGAAGGFHRMPGGAFSGPHPMSFFKVGKARAGRRLDGRIWDQMPGGAG